MKYEVRIHKSELRDVQVEAESPEEAIDVAIQNNPGFSANSAVEITIQDGEGTEYGEEHTIEARCENCQKIIWDGEEYSATEDGDFCVGCARAMKGAS